MITLKQTNNFVAGSPRLWKNVKICVCKYWFMQFQFLFIRLSSEYMHVIYKKIGFRKSVEC